MDLEVSLLSQPQTNPLGFLHKSVQQPLDFGISSLSLIHLLLDSSNYKSSAYLLPFIWKTHKIPKQKTITSHIPPSRKKHSWEFPGGSAAKTPHSQEARARSLVGKLKPECHSYNKSTGCN